MLDKQADLTAPGIVLLRKAHLGEVTVSVWPPILKAMCAGKNIHVLE